MKKPTFEHATCTRCNGSGKFSYNLTHGDRCYGCGGSGFKLTIRGRRAQEFLDNLRKRPASEITVGQVIFFDNYPFKSYFAPVESITQLESGSIELMCHAPVSGEVCRHHILPSQLARFGFSAEEKQEQVRQALNFQATLNKDGTFKRRPTKRK